MQKAHFIHYDIKWTSVFFLILILFFNSFFITNSNASDSLSYSGRLVQTNGAPVAGPVNLLVELSYTNAPSTILCSQSFTGVALSNGVFHLKLDLNCGANGALADVLTLVPANESAAIRVTDVTHAKTYSFQAMHSMPFANIAGTAKQLIQMGASNNQVLKWNDTTKKWEPGSIAGAGTVTSVSGTLPISVASGSTSPVVSIAQANSTTDGYLSSADWNTFNGKQGSIVAGTTAQYYRGDKSWQTLDTSAVPENIANLYFTNARALGVPLTGFATGAGAIVATDTTLQAFGKAQGQINALVTAGSNYLIKNSTDSITGVVNIGTIGALNLTYTPTNLTDATNKSYVDTQISSSAALKINKAGDTMSGALALDNTLKIKGGANYVTINGHAATSAYNLILPPSAGTAGNVLQTDGAGNLSWIAPATSAAPSGAAGGDLSGTYPNPTVNNLPESKITNLTTDLASKVSSTLANGNILVGNASNVASAVVVSGDATLANTGALTLKNTGTAGTYSSVTTDAQGRVVSGSNPTVVTAVSVAAPITNAGTAAVPLIGMPAATSVVDGYLTSTDWNTFNNKQAVITSASNLNTGSVTTNLQGGVVVNPYGTTAGQTGEIRLKELEANGSTYVALKAPDLLASNVTYTLPAADGSNGQVLTTNSTGGLSWTSVATTGTNLVGDISGTIGANTIGAGKVTLTHLSATGTKNNSTYLRGDNTWSVLQADVQALLLSAYSLGTNAVVSTSDSVVSAFGKLQKQISDLTTSAVGGDLTGNLPNPTIAKLQGTTVTTSALANKNVLKYNGTNWANSMLAASDLSATGTSDATTYLAGDNTWKNFNTNVIAAPLTGLSSTGINKSTSALLATDSITAAFNKLLFTQGDYVSKSADQTINGTLAINSLTGFITVPTPVGVNDAVNKGYVDGFGQWTKGASSSINYTAGNVGIGTTVPGHKLDVANLTAVNDVSATQFSVIAGADATLGPLQYIVGLNPSATAGSRYGFIGIGDSSAMRPLILNSNGVGAFGNVGLGTAYPTYSASVQADLNVDNANVNNGTITNTLRFGSGGVANPTAPGTGTGEAIGSKRTVGGNRYGLDFYTGSQTRMAITNGGNVGIGTTSPGTTLEVNGVIKTSSSTTDCPGTWACVGYFWDLSVASIYYSGLSQRSDRRLKKDIASLGMDSLSRIQKMNPVQYRWRNNKFGPGLKFGLIAQEVEQVWPEIVQTANDEMKTKSVDYTQLISPLILAAKKTLPLASALAVDSNGHIGIGTTTPGYALDVNGSIAAVGALQTHSDKRLKKNIVKVDHSLDKLLALNGVYFDWRKDEFPEKHFEGGRQMGVIAQDVEKVFPEAVSKNKEGVRSVAYTMLIAPVIEAFKEMNIRVTGLFKASEGHSRDIASVNSKTAKLEAENAKLKARADKAEKENAEIKARLEKIEKALNSK